MSKIVNEAKIKNKFIVKIRELLEHRAFWLYLLVDEARKRGLAPEDFATAAITRYSLSQGSDLVKKSGTKRLKENIIYKSGKMGVWNGCCRKYWWYTFNTMKQIASKYDTEIRVKENEYYIPASLNSKGYKYIKKTVEKIFDYAIAAPFILPAGTDARRFTELTDATIRFAPIDIDSQQYASVHGENENISVDKIHLADDFIKNYIH